MAITLPIMNPQIVPPDASSSSVALWEVRVEFPGSAPLAICDTQREAEAFVAALELDGLYNRIAKRLGAEEMREIR